MNRYFQRGIRSVVAIVTLLGATAALAQSYPNRPLRFLVPYSVGTTTDVVARIYTQKLGEVLGQSIIVENRVGAGGNIAAEAVARAAPDGYTISFATSATHATNPALYGKVPFDPIKDFTHITLLFAAPNMLAVSAKVPVQNMAELIAYARANPGKLTYLSAGSGTSPHMAGELLKTMAGIDIRHVPYRNISQGFNDLFSGEVSMTFYHAPLIYPHVKAGKLKALGVATRERSPLAPEVPSISDTVTGYDLRPWWSLCGPAGMSQEVIDRLYQASTAVLNNAEVRERLIAQGMLITPMPPKELNEFTVSELAKWSKLVRDSGARVD